jgi:DTW domain-containing protein
VDNVWPVRILQDRRESKHAMGTARIAKLSLRSCELTVLDADKPELGATREAISQCLNSAAGQPVLIYPGVDALPLQQLTEGPVRPLIFLDASWRRSRLILHTCPALASLPRYGLTTNMQSRYRIRKAPESGALSTLEAIVMALGILDGGTERFDPLLKVMDWMVDQQINAMGDAVYRANYDAQTRRGYACALGAGYRRG